MSGRFPGICVPALLLILIFRGRRFVPQFFEKDISTGVPTLTAAGRKAIEEEMQEEMPHTMEPATPRAELADPTEKVAA